MDDNGSALVEHLFALLLVAAIGLGLIQVALTVHARNTVVACAAEGARIASRDDAAGASERTAACVRDAVGVEVEVSVASVPLDGLPGVEVRVEGAAPVLGLGSAGRLVGTARAIDEAAVGAS